MSSGTRAPLGQSRRSPGAPSRASTGLGGPCWRLQAAKLAPLRSNRARARAGRAPRRRSAAPAPPPRRCPGTWPARARRRARGRPPRARTPPPRTSPPGAAPPAAAPRRAVVRRHAAALWACVMNSRGGRERPEPAGPVEAVRVGELLTGVVWWRIACGPGCQQEWRQRCGAPAGGRSACRAGARPAAGRPARSTARRLVCSATGSEPSPEAVCACTHGKRPQAWRLSSCHVPAGSVHVHTTLCTTVTSPVCRYDAGHRTVSISLRRPSASLLLIARGSRHDRLASSGVHLYRTV